MIQSIDFHNYDMKDSDTFPKESGKYLIRYFPIEKGDHLPEYEIVWWINEFKGFYFDQNCIQENNIEKKFDFRVFGWAFLPNMLETSGKYYLKPCKRD